VALAAVTQWVREELIAQATPVVEMCPNATHELHMFWGIDLSPAPRALIVLSRQWSCVAWAYRIGWYAGGGGCSHGRSKKHCTANLWLLWLMLPVLEDAGLGLRWERVICILTSYCSIQPSVVPGWILSPTRR